MSQSTTLATTLQGLSRVVFPRFVNFQILSVQHVCIGSECSVGNRESPKVT